MTSPTHIEWNLHILRGDIDDGNPDIHVGEVHDWGVIGFWSNAALTQSLERTKTAIPLANSYYRVNAAVIYISYDPDQWACILDFGIKAISESGGLLGVPLPRECQEGDYVTGEIRLDLPLCTSIHPHELVQQFRVNRVSADLADFRMFPGDMSEVRYQDASGTDSVRAGSYVLHCSHLTS